MKKCVTINNKEKTANILNIFLYTKSDFIVFDFAMKSLPIIVLLAEDNLTDFHKIQNFICIQTCDSPNFKKPEMKHTFMMSTQKGNGEFGS